ncbi:MAG: MFS transporter [Pseudomonadales bacterium]|jgi:MFS family permease|nr:MFS transporter [Pseudomonadales bacterium]
MTDANPVEQPRDPAYGWVMVFVVFLLSALAFGALGSISVFLKPLVTEFGWSRGQTSFGYTVISFSSAVFGVLWGYIADRYGTRWFGLIAAFAMSGSLFALSQQESILQFYGLYFLFGAFGNAMVTSPLFANVGFWFTHKPGLALGITASGGAVGQAVVPYLCALSLELYGWQTTYMLSAACYLALALPVALLIRESPSREEARLQPVDEVRTFPLSEREVILWISVAIIFCCTCMSVPIVHLVPLLTDSGFSLDQATTVLMVLMFSGALGRILGGRLGDLIGALPSYMVMSAGQTLSVFWFPFLDSTAAIYFVAVVFGFTYSGVMSAILVCTRMMVSAKVAARAMSITSFFGWFGMGAGGFMGGYLFDLTGNYDAAFIGAMIVGFINLAILTLFALRIRRQSRGLVEGAV